MSDANNNTLSPVEGIKARSNFLRGTIADGLADSATGALAEDDTQLSKFHGFYQQDDRDARADRQRRKLEPALSFMIRVRVPGGIATPAQWLAMDELATTHANNTLRLTTRQVFQLHGVIKRDLKATIRGINDSLLDTIAACGDVNRNVMCTPLATHDAVHKAAYSAATRIGAHLLPRTRAYHEIWLDGEKLPGSDSAEPIYGATYLPRKFKIAVAIPPSNDVDVFAHDLGLIAIENDGELEGFNVTVGGGMGMTHGEPETYPRVADMLGFCTPEQVTAVAEHVLTVQRDYGDRTNRKHARLKYTIDDRGLDWFRRALYERLGFELEAPRPYRFTTRGDRFGWSQDASGNWDLTLFVPEGRVQDKDEHRMLEGLREIARTHTGDFRLTANQNLVIHGIADADRPGIEALLDEYGIGVLQSVSPLRQQAMACVALPTCGLAMAEAERWLPELTERVDALLADAGLANEPLSLRITGCPNGCARPYLAEVALVGKAPGHYALYLGGDAEGYRLNRLLLENADEETIFATLGEWFSRYAKERDSDESFGDFADRLLPAEAA